MCVYVAIVVVENLYPFAAGVTPQLILREPRAFSTTSGGQRHSLAANANVANDDPRGAQRELQPDICLHPCLHRHFPVCNFFFFTNLDFVPFFFFFNKQKIDGKL